jgi:hypothetical protein
MDKEKSGAKEPFVSKQDRPDVKISLDTPITELRVRDLAGILGLGRGKDPNFENKEPIKDFFDKDFPEVAKDWLKEVKFEKVEKPEKPEKFEKNEKLEKIEKREKSEIKDFKNEKLERDPIFEPNFPQGPDPTLQQVIQTIAGLTRQVSQLANQVQELQKKIK